jgi:hypothetical protein
MTGEDTAGWKRLREYNGYLYKLHVAKKEASMG